MSQLNQDTANRQQVTINFVVKGQNHSFSVPVGTTVLEVAHQNNIPLEGACEGSLACSTCHVIVDKAFYSKLPNANEDEEDMLDLAFGLTATSRLGCQIVMTADLDGLVVTVPEENRNIAI